MGLVGIGRRGVDCHSREQLNQVSGRLARNGRLAYPLAADNGFTHNLLTLAPQQPPAVGHFLPDLLEKPTWSDRWAFRFPEVVMFKKSAQGQAPANKHPTSISGMSSPKQIWSSPELRLPQMDNCSIAEEISKHRTHDPGQGTGHENLGSQGHQNHIGQ